MARARVPIRELSELGRPFQALVPAVVCGTVPGYVRRELPADAIPPALYTPNQDINSRIWLVQGDITKLKLDAVQNAANRGLLGGGGIDGAIHRAAGHQLLEFNRTLGGCETGRAKVSPGFNLPAKYVVSTVGPVGEQPQLLRNAYWNTLESAFNGPLPELSNPDPVLGSKRKQPEPSVGVSSIALCGVSTGIYGYPLENATHVALNTVRQWLEEPKNREKAQAIVFCSFLDEELETYSRLLPYYFPPEPAAAREPQPAEDAAKAEIE